MQTLSLKDAIKQDNADQVIAIWTNNPQQRWSLDSSSTQLPLTHVLVMHGRAHLLRQLLLAGADINGTDSQGNGLLHCIAQCQHHLQNRINQKMSDPGLSPIPGMPATIANCDYEETQMSRLYTMERFLMDKGIDMRLKNNAGDYATSLYFRFGLLSEVTMRCENVVAAIKRKDTNKLSDEFRGMLSIPLNSKGEHAYHLAKKGGHNEVMSLLSQTMTREQWNAYDYDYSMRSTSGVMQWMARTFLGSNPVDWGVNARRLWNKSDVGQATETQSLLRKDL